MPAKKSDLLILAVFGVAAVGLIGAAWYLSQRPRDDEVDVEVRDVATPGDVIPGMEFPVVIGAPDQNIYRVSFAGISKTTSASGLACFSVPAGNHRLTLTSAGGTQVFSGNIPILAGTKVNVEAPNRVNAFTITVDEAGQFAPWCA